MRGLIVILCALLLAAPVLAGDTDTEKAKVSKAKVKKPAKKAAPTPTPTPTRKPAPPIKLRVLCYDGSVNDPSMYTVWDDSIVSPGPKAFVWRFKLVDGSRVVTSRQCDALIPPGYDKKKKGE